MLTAPQLTALRAYIDASTDPNVISWRTPATRADNALATWLNERGSVDAWRAAADPSVVDDASNWTAFDSLTPGKRDSWAMFLARARDFTRGKVRSWVTDVWGAATAASDSEKILQAGMEKARRSEEALGGTQRTTGTASALERAYVGEVSIDDVSAALSL